MLFIGTPEKNQDVKLVLATAEHLGWNTYSEKFFISEEVKNTSQDKIGGVYGEQYFCEIIAKQMNWHLVKNPSDWIVSLPKTFSNRNVNVMKHKDAKNILVSKFIKSSDDVYFKHRVFDNPDDLPANYIYGERNVIVSDPMTFTSKYRCFVMNRKVVSVCCYYLKSINIPEPEINVAVNYSRNNDDVICFVDGMLKDDTIPCVPACVIDVGRFKKDTYAVIDSRPAFCSKLYGCEQVASFDVIQASCDTGV